MKAKLLYPSHDLTGEAATWLPKLGIFLWVDIDNGILHQLDLNTQTVKDHFFPELITSIIPWKGHDYEVILAMKNRIISYHLVDAKFASVADIYSIRPQWRTNDCKASPEGRLWCGIMNTTKPSYNGFLYRIESDLSCSSILDKQSIPNGISWNHQGDRMYYADSGRSCIEEYAYDHEKGTISFIRTVVDVPPKYGIPDGMAIDSDDNLWVAHWGGKGVYIWNSSTGKLIDKIEVSAPNVASCTFGGKDGKELFITTALVGMSEDEKQMYPQSGGLFSVEMPNVSPGENHYPFITV